jgi:betaine-aldehyde dehydrogenase
VHVHDALFYDGSWHKPSSTAVLDVISPATEEVVGRVPATTSSDVDAAVASARRAFDMGPWRLMSAQERAHFLRAMRDALELRLDAVARVVTLETGSPLWYSARMQKATLRQLSYYADNAAYVDHITASARPRTATRIRREPMGVAALILPWNGPFGTLISKLAAALIAGCTVVAKPAPETPLDAYLLADAAVEVGLPAGVLNIVHGGAEIGAQLAGHAGVDTVSVTGSVATGRHVLTAAASTIKRSTLELGGKSACLMMPGCDVDWATTISTEAALMNAGQVCIAWSRVFAPRDSYEDVVSGLAEKAAARWLGDPFDPRTQMGPLTTPLQRSKVEDHLERARTDGAKIVTGGRRPSGFDRGYWFEPTVLRDVTNSMRIAREEVFGPVIAVIPYDTVADAVNMANDSDYGLTAGVLGPSVEHAWSVAKQLRTGTVSINGFFIEDHAPFGGYKQSGLGREWGLEALNGYLETKTVALPGDFLGELS